MTSWRLDLASLARLPRYLRLQPFDTTTAEGRAQERYRRAALTAVASAGSRAVSMTVGLIMVPLALGYLGTQRYGVVVTITALTAMLVFADFGLGNGLMNVVARASGQGDHSAARRGISSAFAMLCAIALLLGLGLVPVWLAVPWAGFMNVSDPAAATEVASGAAMFMAVVILNLPLGIVQRVQLAYQQGFMNGVWNAVGAMVMLGGLIIVIAFHGSLPWVVLTAVGGPLVGNLLNWGWLFVLRRPDLRPRLRSVRGQEARALLRIGSLFFVLQLTIAVAYQSDVVVATRVLGPEAATSYSVVYRLFMVLPTVVNMLLLPLWPAYTESIARGDVEWVRRTLKISVGVALALSGISSAAMLVVAYPILHVWLGSAVHPPMGLLVGMAVWAVVSNSFNAVAMLMNGASVMAFQVATALTMAAVSLGASILLANAWGVSGIVWGTVLAYVLCTAIPTLLYLPRLLRTVHRRVDPSQYANGRPA